MKNENDISINDFFYDNSFVDYNTIKASQFFYDISFEDYTHNEVIVKNSHPQLEDNPFEIF